MAIETDGTGQSVSFGALSAVTNLESRTILVWFYKDTNVNGFLLVQVAGGSSDETYSITTTTAGTCSFTAGWSGAVGQWTLNNSISTGAFHLVAVTYSNGSTVNDPIWYVDGASVAFTENTAPSGTYRIGTNTTFLVGGPISNDGKGFGINIYNRIFTPAEIAEAYASRLAVPNRNGLVFAPHLSGAAGLQTFDGATLGADNKIVDQISGALGTPAGSPVGRADTYLTYR